MECKTPNICRSRDFGSLCEFCMASLEETAIQNTQNMGIPDRYGCYNCGGWFESAKSFSEHYPCLVEDADS